MLYDDDAAIVLLKLTGVADCAAVIWLIVRIINHRHAKPAILAVVAMFFVTLAVLFVTLPAWAW